MNVQLLLDGREVELSKKVSVPLNKTFEELSNPTKIIVDYSKSVNIPATILNNKILGHAYRLDRGVMKSKNTNIGLYLDPAKKIPFVLLYNSQLIMEGYCKFVSAHSNNFETYYTLNLFGTLGDIMQKMMNIVPSIDMADDGDEKYVLNDMLPGTLLSKEYVLESWNLLHHDTRSIQNGKPSDMKEQDIIGFAPAHHGQYDDFESDKIDVGGEIKTLEEYLRTNWIATYKKIYPESTDEDAKAYVDALKPGDVLKNMTDYKMKEYRCYGLKPYIYIDKLFNMYQAKCKELTDYDMILDPSWFNNDNIYWNNVTYMLNYADKYSTTSSQDIISNGTKSNPYNVIATGKDFSYSDFIINTTSESAVGNKTFNVAPIQIDFRGHYKHNTSEVHISDIHCNMDAAFDITIYIYDRYNGEDTLVHGQKYWAAPGAWNPNLIPHDGEHLTNNYLHTKDEFSDFNQETRECNYGFSVTVPNFNYKANIRGEMVMKVRSQFIFPVGTPHHPEGPIRIQITWPGGKLDYLSHNALATDIMKVSPISITAKGHVDTPVKIESFYKAEEPLFNVLLRYTKMFGLIWGIDYAKHQITISPRDSYFRNYKIVDWNNKVDRQHNFMVSPITFDSKYVNFNYDAVDGHNYSQYQNKYGVEYGAKKMKTTYDFDSEDKDLFDGLKPSCTSNRTYSTFDSMVNWDLRRQIPNEIEKYQLIDDDDEDGSKNIGLNNFYFRIDNQEIYPPNDIKITDDSQAQIDADIKCWGGVNNVVYPKYFPIFSIAYPRDGFAEGITFNTPSRDYTSSKLLSGTIGHCVFDKFWKEYLDERYNIQNKKLTCYVDLSPRDFLSFKFSTFVTVDNQIFMVNKIIDYNLNDGDKGDRAMTKVELTQITDLGVYTGYPNLVYRKNRILK